jgi:hypothetical protein
VCRPRADRFLRDPPWTMSILNSSSLWPVSRAATSHLGRFPLPDHVSDGASGLQYFGRTFGYLRRGVRSVMDSGWALPGSLMISTRFNFAKRFSSSRFSATILPDSILVSSSWSNQSSSNCIASRSGLRIMLSRLFACRTIKIFLDTSPGRRHFETSQSLCRSARRQFLRI